MLLYHAILTPKWNGPRKRVDTCGEADLSSVQLSSATFSEYFGTATEARSGHFDPHTLPRSGVISSCCALGSSTRTAVNPVCQGVCLCYASPKCRSEIEGCEIEETSGDVHTTLYARERDYQKAVQDPYFQKSCDQVWVELALAISFSPTFTTLTPCTRK